MDRSSQKFNACLFCFEKMRICNLGSANANMYLFVNKNLSEATAKMLAFALDKVEKFTSTTSLANDYEKHYHAKNEEEVRSIACI